MNTLVFPDPPRSIEQALEALVLDDRDLRKLEDLLSEPNLFEAIGAVRSELRHSDFLAYLLDPARNHGLRDTLLKRFAQQALSGENSSTFAVSALHLGVWDLSDAVVERETDGIDVLIVSARNRLVISIENKVDSAEHSDQLGRYVRRVAEHHPGYRQLFVLLSADGRAPSHVAYATISYGAICGLVEDLIQHRAASLLPDVVVLLRHYAKLLRRHFMDESELAELARQIYRDHRTALDYIYEQRPDRQLVISQSLRDLVKQSADLVLDASTKRYVRFAPQEWATGDLVRGENWTPSNRLLLFEFSNTPERVVLALVIGRGDQAARQRLFDFAIQNRPPFVPASRRLNDKWNQIWSKKFSSGDLDDKSVDSIMVNLTMAWSTFLTVDLPKIRERIGQFQAQASS